MKRALVTGAGGFVGVNLALRLLREGHEVHLLTRDISRLPDELKNHAQSYTIDLRNREGVFGVVGNAKPEWVFHLAAHGAYSWQTDAQQMIETNVTGTLNLLDATPDVEAFVNTGSSSEYGFRDHACKELEPVEPNSHYAVTKAAATMLCRYSAGAASRFIPTVRLYSIYGPYEHPNRLVPRLLRCAARGELPPLVDPNIARDLVYVEDACDAFLLAATTRTDEAGAIFNIGSGVQTTVGQIVEMVRAMFGIQAEPSWGSMPNRRWDADIWVADITKAELELGWTPSTSLDAGLRRAYDFWESCG